MKPSGIQGAILNVNINIYCKTIIFVLALGNKEVTNNTFHTRIGRSNQESAMGQ